MILRSVGWRSRSHGLHEIEFLRWNFWSLTFEHLIEYYQTCTVEGLWGKENTYWIWGQYEILLLLQGIGFTKKKCKVDRK